MNRRTLLKHTGQAGALAGLAGCIGGSGGGGGNGNGNGGGGGNGGSAQTSIKWAGGTVKDSECWDCIHPMVVWRTLQQAEERSDGAITGNYIGGNQLCSEKSCGSKLRQGIVDVGVNSVANSTKFFPENDVFMLPYTVPATDSQSLTHAGVPKMIFDGSIWEDYWIPFAQEYGVVPFAGAIPALRSIFMSTEYDGPAVTSPSDLEGLRIRRTFSGTSEIAVSNWGAEPVDVSWGDAIQGMKSGVVDGLETWTTVGLSIGLGEVSSQVTVNNWQIGYRANWASLDWLKSLPAEHQQILGEVTKQLTVDVTKLVPEVLGDRAGALASPPPEGTMLAETDTGVNLVSEEEMNEWKAPISPAEGNKDLYSDQIAAAESLSKSGIYDQIAELAADPPNIEDFSTDDIGWWHEYLDEL